MSERDLKRIEVLSDVRTGRRTFAAAATVLAVSERQAYRLLARYECDGGSGLIHKARGRSSNRSKNEGIRKYAVELVRTRYARYADFGPTRITLSFLSGANRNRQLFGMSFEQRDQPEWERGCGRPRVERAIHGIKPNSVPRDESDYVRQQVHRLQVQPTCVSSTARPKNAQQCGQTGLSPSSGRVCSGIHLIHFSSVTIGGSVRQ